MFKRIFAILVTSSLIIYAAGCTNQTTTASSTTQKGYTPYTTQDIQDIFPIGMPIDQYISKKNTLPVKHVSSIPLTDGNIGRVLQTKDGFAVVCGDEKEIFDIIAFKTLAEVQSYERSLKK
ncbi:hypothetical protein [Bacillus wiedmannii]|uniref:hypothetical protein n=1 Tax=Bacillus wiedmannii TaxID=1890302 RepID=UPI000BF0D8C6|nr:hypothetical protein [Bacillus wiedmannii]PEO40895.1 hypothetical protein CN555_02240 [Bacillus wiedmannii]